MENSRGKNMAFEKHMGVVTTPLVARGLRQALNNPNVSQLTELLVIVFFVLPNTAVNNAELYLNKYCVSR